MLFDTNSYYDLNFVRLSLGGGAVGAKLPWLHCYTSPVFYVIMNYTDWQIRLCIFLIFCHVMIWHDQQKRKTTVMQTMRFNS